MNFEITNVKPMDKNTLQALFTIVIGPMEIEGWTYHIKNDKSWVNPPSKEYLDSESGEKKYYPIIKIPDKDRYWNFQKWAVSEVESRLHKPLKKETDDEIPF